MKAEKDAVYWKAQETALAYLDYKLRTGEEVRKKLLEKQFPPETVELVLEFLLHYGYVNDRTYCESYIRDSLRFHPKGRSRLRLELLQRGVDRQTVEEVLSRMEIREAEDAYRLLEKKYKGKEPLDPKERQKAAGFLQRRGYAWPVVREALERLEEGEK